MNARTVLQRIRRVVVEWLTPLFLGLGLGAGGSAAVDQADGVQDCCRAPAPNPPEAP